MTKKLIQILIVLLFGISLIAANPLSIVDEGNDGGSRAYCVTTASNPVKWGNYVRGTGTVTCTGTTGWIRVDVDLVDSTADPDRTSFNTGTCYNTTSCTVHTYLYLVGYSGHYYQTKVSGYYPNNSSYDESPLIRVYY